MGVERSVRMMVIGGDPADGIAAAQKRTETKRIDA